MDSYETFRINSCIHKSEQNCALAIVTHYQKKYMAFILNCGKCNKNKILQINNSIIILPNKQICVDNKYLIDLKNKKNKNKLSLVQNKLFRIYDNTFCIRRIDEINLVLCFTNIKDITKFFKNNLNLKIIFEDNRL